MVNSVREPAMDDIDIVEDDVVAGEGVDPAMAAEEAGTEPLPAKVRKPRLTFGSQMLLDPDRGLPFLLREGRQVRFHGKGHEARDLTRLMRLYRDWAKQVMAALWRIG